MVARADQLVSIDYRLHIARKSVPVWVRVLLVIAFVATVLAARRSFFSGKLLTDDEFSDEQEYRVCRRRLH